MNKDGGVVEVHNGSSVANQRNLYACVGTLDVVNHRVIFGASQSFDTGADSSVTVNEAGTVVEAHNGTTSTTERNLYFTVGQANFSTKTVTWGFSSKHGTGSQPSIGLNDNHKFVALHHDLTDDQENGIYFTFGYPNPSTKTIDWEPEVGGLRDIGMDAAIAIATDGILLETHSAPSPSTATALWYSAADILRLP